MPPREDDSRTEDTTVDVTGRVEIEWHHDSVEIAIVTADDERFYLGDVLERLDRRIVRVRVDLLD
jgi:hypothetical protein